MKTWLVMTCLWMASVGILQSPNDKGPTKQNGAGGNSPSNQHRPGTTGSPQSLPPSTVANRNQQIDSAHDTSQAAQSGADIETQRQLAEFTKYLVWVGGIQAFILAGTLLLIWRQANLLQTHAGHLKCLANAAAANAVAAKKSAEVLLEGQRPTIAAAIVGNPTKDLHDRDAPRIQVSISNKGATTAYELTYQSWIELLPFPFIDFTEEADHFASENPYSLYPNHDPVALNIPIRKGLTEAQLKDLRELKVYACVRVRVAFRDAFSPSRYSNFGFYVMREGAGFLPKYNDSN